MIDPRVYEFIMIIVVAGSMYFAARFAALVFIYMGALQ